MSEQLTVVSTDWSATCVDLKAKGFVRCEWLTATHNQENEFVVTARFATESLDNSVLVSTVISDGEINSIVETYPVADFHEREAAQMFGIKFRGNDTSRLAFETEFDGHPLRRDFALATRAETSWPGAVEPDESARRRPSLPPGVFEEWQK